MVFAKRLADWIVGPFYVRGAERLQVTGQGVPPFGIEERSDGLRLILMGRQTVTSVDDGKVLFTSEYVDGNLPEAIRLTVPKQSRAIAISSAQGNWQIVRFSATPRWTAKDFIFSLQNLARPRDQATALLIHILIFVVATFALPKPAQDIIQAKQPNTAQSSQGETTQGGQAQANRSRATLNPFNGGPLFLNQASSDGGLSVLTQMNQTLATKSNKQTSNSKGQAATSESAFNSSPSQSLGLPSLIGASRFRANLSTGALNTPTKTVIPSPRKDLSPEGEARVRKIMAGLEPRFSKLFDQITKKHPNLAVTLQYEVQVNSQGNLFGVQFTTSESFESQGLSELKSGMLNILQSVNVGADLNGVVIRGQNLFRR